MLHYGTQKNNFKKLSWEKQNKIKLKLPIIMYEI